MKNPLEAVLEWYLTANDCMRVTQRVLAKRIGNAITEKHLFYDLPERDALRQLDRAKSELANHAVVALVAAFERALRNYLITRVDAAFAASETLSEAMRTELASDVEFWHISARVIDGVFKHRVRAELAGMVKQIIDYRNRIAHGHVLGRPPPANAVPVVVFRRLTDFLVESEVVGHDPQVATPNPQMPS